MKKPPAITGGFFFIDKLYQPISFSGCTPLIPFRSRSHIFCNRPRLLHTPAFYREGDSLDFIAAVFITAAGPIRI